MEPPPGDRRGGPYSVPSPAELGNLRRLSGGVGGHLPLVVDEVPDGLRVVEWVAIERKFPLSHTPNQGDGAGEASGDTDEVQETLHRILQLELGANLVFLDELFQRALVGVLGVREADVLQVEVVAENIDGGEFLVGVVLQVGKAHAGGQFRVIQDEDAGQPNPVRVEPDVVGGDFPHQINGPVRGGRGDHGWTPEKFFWGKHKQGSRQGYPPLVRRFSRRSADDGRSQALRHSL